MLIGDGQERHHGRGALSQIRNGCVNRYGGVIADGNVLALEFERPSTRSPPTRNTAATVSNAIFAIPRPGTGVARRGLGFDAGWWGRADMSQQQCPSRQQSADCALWHCDAAGSHHSARACQLPMSEITSSIVNNLKAVRIDGESLCRQLRPVKERPAETAWATRLLRRGKKLLNSVSRTI